MPLRRLSRWLLIANPVRLRWCWNPDPSVLLPYAAR
jgi:hypothetical protein